MDSLLTLLALFFACLLPWGTNVPIHSKPVVTYTLIAVNLGVHLITQIVELLGGTPIMLVLSGEFANRNLESYISIFALTPSELERGDWRIIQLVTANFLHAGWDHLIFNVWLFYLYAVNLEDRFGPYKFGMLIGVSMLLADAAIIGTTYGTSAYSEPHLGFSGVVYGVMGAYLVCFPRSSINVMLVYDIIFWIVALTLGSLGALIASIFLGSLGGLAWFAIFLGLFSAMDPARTAFGVPAFLFLGYKIGYDFLTVQEQAESGISIWSHWGGLFGGVLVALGFNGLTGLRERHGVDINTDRPISKREQARIENSSLAKAAETQEYAARELLNRIVFMSNGMAATQLYRNLVMPKYPDLVLEPDKQLTLARLLDAQGDRTSALDAYVKLLDRFDLRDVREPALSAAARLCLETPGGDIARGVGYVDELLRFELLYRDRITAEALRDSLLQAAARKRVEVPGHELPPVHADEIEQPVDKRPRPVEVPLQWDGRIPMREEPGSLIKRRAAARAEAQADTITDAGWKTISASARLKPPPTPAAKESPSNEPSQATPDSSAPLEFPAIRRRRTAAPDNGMPVLSMKRLSLRTASPESSGEPPDDSADYSVPRGPLKRETPEDIAKRQRDLQRRMFGSEEQTWTGGMGDEAKPARPAFWAGTRKPESQAGPAHPPGETYSLVLQPGSSVEPKALAEYLDSIARLISTMPGHAGRAGVLVPGIDKDNALRLRSDAADRGIPLVAIRDLPVFSSPPAEILSFSLTENGLTLRASTETSQVRFEDIVQLHFGEMRLMPSSRSSRKVIDLIARNPAGVLARHQIWDRTIQPARCTILGLATNARDPLPDLFGALINYVVPGALTPEARQFAESGKAPAVCPSLNDYEAYVAGCALLRLGEKVESPQAS